MVPFDYPEAGATAPASGPHPEGEAVTLKKYDVVVDGHETTLLLSDEDAAKAGLKPAESKAAPPARNKARTAQNKGK